MQEHRPDFDVLTDHATDEKLKRALEDPRNSAVTIHKPGSRVTLRSGATYEVQADGSWKRAQDEPTREET